MKIKSPFRNTSRSSGSEKGLQFEEPSDGDRCSDIWKVIGITRGPWVLDGWQKCLLHTYCQHQSTTGLASSREPRSCLCFGASWVSIIWAGSLGVLLERNTSLKLDHLQGRFWGLESLALVFFCFPERVGARVLHL